MPAAVTELNDHPKPKVQAVEEAIQLALSFRWEEAAAANRELLERFGPDEDAHNRLGKALMELGQLEAARQAYQATLDLNPTNPIAKRQLAKLADQGPAPTAGPPAGALDIKFFTEEPGKTALTRLVRDEGPAPAAVLPGDPVELVVSSGHVTVRSVRGAELGSLEPRLARRVSRMVEGGNRYAGAVTHVDSAGIQVIIREVQQAPQMAGIVSFPSRKAKEVDYRPYTKEPSRAREPQVVEVSDEDDEDLVRTRPVRVADEMEEGFTEFSELDDADEAEDDADEAEDDDAF